ncbi:hypothetical protein LTR37_000065 [Vermiconidia calcicola]|uniref:Uncharacterized protein n=1 Tax=Vermiconidia calcicola TaxID=1690605 RepID=A0ACC3P0V9_9PEZI|nr:hypothetical protein LTR37_000065 [Vermiconidia calcicola]
MAQHPSLGQEIFTVIQELCTALDAKYVNFFYRATLNDLDRPAERRRYLVATGSHAIQEWRYGDDIHLVCMTQNSQKLFWPYVAEHLSLKDGISLPSNGTMELSSPALLRTLNGAGSVISKIAALSRKNKAGCKFYLHYAIIPLDFDPTCMRDEFMPDLPLKNHPGKHRHKPPYAQVTPVERNYDIVHDTHSHADNILQRSVPSVDVTSYRQVYRILRDFVDANGLFGPQLGFLNNETLMIVAYGAQWRGPQPRDGPNPTWLTRALRHINSDLYWQEPNDGSIYPNVDPTITRYNTARNVTQQAWRAIRASVQHTLELKPLDPSAYCNHNERLHEFLTDYHHFIKVECELWEASPTQRAEFEESTISANVNAIVQYFWQNRDASKVSGIRIRLWPVAFVEKTQDSRQVFAIGLERSRSDQRNQLPMRQYASRIISDISETVLNYDQTSSRISVSLETSEAFAPLLEDVSDDDALTAGVETMAVSSSAPRSSETSRFRTASQAINRLRHDPAHAGVEYDLAFLDRFEGLKWVALEDWGKKATEDEDFIPEHRVRVLRRKEDGVVVWDREQRLDRTGG